MLSQAELSQIKAATNIADLLSQDITLKKSGQERFTALCPFHDEKTASFVVFQKTNSYHCFSCGSHGDVISWLMEYRHYTFRQAIILLADRAGIEIDGPRCEIPEQAMTPAKAAEFEDAVYQELWALIMCLEPRVHWRKKSSEDQEYLRHISRPPSGPVNDREILAAKRLLSGLGAYYASHIQEAEHAARI